MYAAAVIGASGYTGAELLGVIARHPDMELALATSDNLAGTAVGTYYPCLTDTAIANIAFEQHAKLNDSLEQGKIDLAFLAVPHGKSLDLAPSLLEHGVAVIDLSGSYRLTDAGMYAQYYGHKHSSPELLDSAIYGLPELNRAQLLQAGKDWLANKAESSTTPPAPHTLYSPLVAAPGCYPTAIALSALPLLKLSNFDYNFGIVANAISGITGAGKAACEGELGSRIAENSYAYNPLIHRHTPEIQQILNIAAGAAVNLSFVPHLVPMRRGMVTTITARLDTTKEQPIDETTLHKFFEDYYQSSPLVSILSDSEMPQSKAQTGSNQAEIGLALSSSTDGKYQTIISSCAIDNLGKGASYQAMQCANLLIGADESTGLKQIKAII